MRIFSRRLLALANLVLALVFLLACAHPWLSPETFWFIGYLSIAFPYLLLALLLFLVFWIFSSRHRWYVLLSLLPLFIGYRQIGVLAGTHRAPFNKQKAAAHVRVMTWNIMSFNGFVPGQKAREQNADRIFSVIKEYEPDIVCLQEYGQYENPQSGRGYVDRMKKMGYRYYVLSRDYSRVTYSYSNGLAIFSKLPLFNKERVPYRSSAESLLFADVARGRDTFRLFTTHLQSYRFSDQEREAIEKVKSTEKPSYFGVKSLVSKMQRAFRNRGAQVDQALPYIEGSPYPTVVCLDMNDVPASYAYWKMKNGSTDAFLSKGFGIGRTYMSLLPTLRIDYIFAHPGWKVEQVALLSLRYSDHLPLIADLSCQK